MFEIRRKTGIASPHMVGYICTFIPPWPRGADMRETNLSCILNKPSRGQLACDWRLIQGTCGAGPSKNGRQSMGCEGKKHPSMRLDWSHM